MAHTKFKHQRILSPLFDFLSMKLSVSSLAITLDDVRHAERIERQLVGCGYDTLERFGCRLGRHGTSSSKIGGVYRDTSM